jgi:hypothetical protein
MATIRKLFKTHLLDKMAKSFRSSEDGSYFLFFGKPLPWSDENAPGEPSETVDQDYAIWENMLGAKRISSAKVIFMTDKLSHTTGITLAASLSNTDHYSDRFVVHSSSNYVYKVIKNGQDSTDKTSVQFTDNFSTSLFGTNDDGYDYKLLYKIPDYLQEYITDTHIPLLEVDLVDGRQSKYNDERQFRYNVKNDAVDGSIEAVKIDNPTGGGKYPVGSDNLLLEPWSNRPDISAGYKIPEGSSVSTTSIQLRLLNETHPDVFNNASVDNDSYNNHALYIKKGQGAGQIRKITDYVGQSNDGGDFTITVDPPLDSTPARTNETNTTEYHICPYVGITGDGHGANAIGIVNPDGTLKEIDIIDTGSEYTTANATITSVSTGDDYNITPSLSPKGGHGFDILNEVRPTKMLIVVRIKKDENGTIPIFNDYRQYGLLADPLVAGGYTNEGLVAGVYDDTSTTVSINAPTGGRFSTSSFQSGDFVIGKETNTCGKVSSSSLGGSEQKSALLIIKNLKGTYKNSEEVVGIRDKGSDVFNNSLVGSGFIGYQDPTLPSSDRTYRMTISAGITSDDVLNRDSISKDSLVTGASGATAMAVQWLPFFGATGTSGSILLSNLSRNSSITGGTMPTAGFVNSETITIGSSSYTINNIKGPELVKGSGRIIIAENTTPVTRTFEQEEEIRLFVDL